MKKSNGMSLVILLIIVLSTFCIFAENEAVGLKLDGKEIITDTPAVIVSERTLVPARAVFEALGGTAGWDDLLREVTIQIGENILKLRIDNKTAQLNGVSKEMDVPAAIINERTMIPVRFVSEAMGYKVDWDNDNRIVNISSEKETSLGLTIKGISLGNSDSAYVVTVNADREIEDYKDFVLSSPDRFVLDIEQAVLSDGIPPLNIGNDTIKSVRFSQFEEDKTRVVVDLKGQTPGTIRVSEDQKTLFIDFEKSEIPDDEEAGILPGLDDRARDMLVVLDPGHGGRDPGAVGYKNGKEVLYEKTINLAVALRINELLKNAGLNIYMTRNADTAVALLERPAIANALKADLYVSIHNNSSDKSTFSGAEILYLNKASEGAYNTCSKVLADLVYSELLNESMRPYRAPIERPLLAVLNKTQMPAIIIEGAFLSNSGDLELMMSDEFKEHYAVAASKAVIKALNDSVRED